ncbi:DUF2267 domain-containing protein [Haloactinomyces albus]|uniref:Uncharacterized protein (DUF2267 family) n=1 Tax=Haloactinomyces albus TaxID=1352928 RepID=A0AAE3Z814_9ACTN|nr:DUF2267 domain-containing protein [Haloactinomyces albus]MDR7300036.1 uncharacterized protein (DUF2267 family) [Haloactinomyces albus]
MQHDAFIGQVQQRAQLASRGEAEAATRAAMETLGERVPEQLADHVASQLPQEIGENFRRTEVFSGAGTGERFDLNEFIQRMSERSGMDEPKATYAARVVFEVLREATQGGVMDKVRDALPEQLRELVDAGSSGEMQT